MSESMRVDLMFPSRYLKAIEFEGKNVTLTIKAVKADMLRMVDSTKAKKFVIQFEETSKELVLNKTNAFAIADYLSERDALKWVGCKITLFPTTCDAFGETVDCIRVKGPE